MRSIRAGGAKRKNTADGGVVEVSKRLLRLWPWLAAITSGLLGAAALPPLDQTWLIWIALVPLCATILFSGENTRRRWLRDLLLGYVAGLTFFWSCFFGSPPFPYWAGSSCNFIWPFISQSGAGFAD